MDAGVPGGCGPGVLAAGKKVGPSLRGRGARFSEADHFAGGAESSLRYRLVRGNELFRRFDLVFSWEEFCVQPL